MKCLSIRQPWAWAVASGIKGVENRGWETPYRGTILVHASANRSEVSRVIFPDEIPDTAGEFVISGAERAGVEPPDLDALAFGAIVGVADLVDCIPYREADTRPDMDHYWAFGPWCWVLANARPVGPRKWPGALKLFDVPDEVAGSLCYSDGSGRLDPPAPKRATHGQSTMF